MMDLLDYMMLFWAVLALVVYALGTIYENCAQAKKSSALRDRDSTKQQLHYDNWSPRSASDSWAASSAGSTQQSSGYYSNGQNYSSHHTTASGNTYVANQQLLSNNSNSYEPRNPFYPTYGNERPHVTTTNFDQQSSQPLDNAYNYQNHSYNGETTQQQYNGGQEEIVNATTSQATIPIATGFNGDCIEWVNEILFLFYTQTHKYGPIIMESLVRSLNEKVSSITSSSPDHAHLIIEFNQSQEGHSSNSRPELTNVRTESESDKSVSAVCKIYNKFISLQLTIKQQQQQQQQQQQHQHQVAHYELQLENLEGKLRSVAMLNDRLIVIQFMERPDTKIQLKPKFGSASAPSTSQLICDDALVQIILQTLAQVVVDLYFGDDCEFPQFKSRSHHHHQHGLQATYSNYKNKINNIFKGSASELKRQIKSDFFGALSATNAGGGDSVSRERKVFVKIVRAKNINYNQNVTCLMELDSPHQQAISSTKQGSNPVWDEHFLFKVTDKSQHLQLELWDSILLTSGTTLSDHPYQQQQQHHHPQQASVRRSQSLNRAGQSAPVAANQEQEQSAQSKWHRQELLGGGGKFLGLARVEIEELRRNPVQKVSLMLQPIGPPGDPNNSVGGELQLELLFLEHSSSSGLLGGAQQATGGSPTSAQMAPPSGLRKSNSASSLGYHQGDIVSIDRKLTPSGYVITTTTITKSPSAALVAGGQARQLRNPSPVSAATTGGDQSLFDDDLLLVDTPGGSRRHQLANFIGADQYTAVATTTPSDRRSEATPSELASGRLSRSRSRSRSFLRAIKKRFSFSGGRSRSVGEPAGGGTRSVEPRNATNDSLGGLNLDTPSLDSRSRASSDASLGGGPLRAKSVPSSRDANEVPTIVINKNRLSDTASAFTFSHPKSQLVIEVEEPRLRDDGNGASGRRRSGHLRHYAVPDTAASKRKWRKRGLKLHLYNEHQFVACHLAGSSTCHLCGRVFSRRPGKQGYKCRNCHLLSHKQCHVKVDHNCPYATSDSLRLEYIDADPPLNLLDEVSPSAGANQRQQPGSGSSSSTHHRPAPLIRMGAKSISMEVDDR